MKHLQIFDNDLDRTANGSQTLQFNKGLPLDQHNGLQKEGIEYLLIQNAKKPRQNTTQVPTHVILGGKDLEVFVKLIVELDVFYKSLGNISSNVDHSNRIVESLLQKPRRRKKEFQRRGISQRSEKSWNRRRTRS